MKTSRWILIAIVAAALGLVGCAKKNTVDTTQLLSSFKGAEASQQGSVDKVVSAVKSADYTGALAELQTLLKDVKLTPEQKAAVNDLIAQVQKVVPDAAASAASEGRKAVDDMKKALPK